MAVFNVLTEYGCESITFVHDEPSGLQAIVAIHSTKRGPAFGGIRTLSYRSQSAALTDAVRLAQAMSFKAAAADLPAGGGKTVVIKHEKMNREAAFQALGRAIERMGGSYFTGLDVGTSADDLKAVGKQTKYAAVRLDFGKSTARGVVASIRAALKFATGSDALDGRRVAIQGLGSVGAELARLLHDGGAALTVADVNSALAARIGEECGAEVVSPAKILTADCDVLSPCALGSVLTSAIVDSLQCKVIAGSANNQLAAASVGKQLAHAGFTYVPDYVANAGALIKGVTEHVQGKEVGYEVVDRIGATVKLVLERAKKTGKPTHEVAELVARERLA